MVYFDQKTISASGDRRASHRRDFVSPACSVRRIDQNRKMRQFLDDRNRRDIERISRVILEGADSALTEHHIVVATGHDVLRRQQPLLNCRRRPTLQQYWTAYLGQ